MRKKRIRSFALLAFLVALPLAAADVIAIKRGTPEHRGRGWRQRLEFEAPVKEGARLLLRAEAGAVDIRPEPDDKVKCVVTLRANTSDEAAARRLFNRVQLSARPLDTGGVYLNSQTRGGVRHGANFGIRFHLSVPSRFNLDVETQRGDITVEAPLTGEARLTTAGGDVRAADLAGPVRIETAGGSITLGKMGSRVDARTAGGSIRVNDVAGDANLETSGGEIVSGQVVGTLRAETAGGDVVIGGATGPVIAQTAGGHIQIGPAGGSVRAETAGGSIRLQGAHGRVVVDTAGGSIDLLQVESHVKASTAAGRILAQFSSTRKTFGSSQLESAMGDVFVYLPTSLPLTIDAAIDAAAGHRIISDFPLTIQGGEEEVVPTTLRGRGALNGGGEVLKIRTVAGNIEIRKLDEQARQALEQREASTWKAWEERRAEKDRRRHEHEEEQKQRQRDEDRDHDGH